MIFGRRRRTDPDLEDLGPQRVRFVPTGAEVYTVARDRTAYAQDGRVWTPMVESGVRTDSIYVDRDARWDDGSPMTPADLAAATDVLSRVLLHWEAENVDVVWPQQ